MRILTVLVLGLVLFSCVRNKNLQNLQIQKQPQQDIPSTSAIIRHKVEVKEVIQATSYTYLRVVENGKEDWIAVNKQEAKIGDTYYYETALEMVNFKSKELNRTFDVIYFVSQLSNDPKTLTAESSLMPHSGMVQNGQLQDIKIKKDKGEISIAELFKNRVQYAGKKIKITGIVVKVNNEIMGKNWIHIQDGTSDAGSFDLTITSQEKVSINSQVTFEGTISVNKDFGAGYTYDVILENATLTN